MRTSRTRSKRPRTKNHATAFKAAAQVHTEIETQFAALRRNKGVTTDAIPTDDWTWPDWRQLAEWFKATLVEEDWRARLKNMPGAALSDGACPVECWRDEETVSAHIALRARLDGLSVGAYAEERFTFVHGLIRRLGVSLTRSNPCFHRFMAECLKAEIEYLDIFFQREGGKLGELQHPDSVRGRWTKAIEAISREQVARIVGSDPQKGTCVGRTLTQALDQWKADREIANKALTPHGIAEKENAIAEFEEHAKVRDIGEITRAQIIDYRGYLHKRKFKVPTINKKVGQITTLLATAQKAGWIDTSFSGGIYVDVPAGTNQREPFNSSELEHIFSQPVFSSGVFSASAKAGGALEFWLPIISVVSGLISTEIMQLGPDTVCPHPEHTEIVCFLVTNAGGRSVKAYSRRRYVPVRRELWENGLRRIVDAAQKEGRTSLWPAVAEGLGLTSQSNMFSAYWSDFLRNQAGLKDDMKTLYSLRHNFRDGITKVGAAKFEQDQLMGHAEQGTGGKYGTKRDPRAVDIRRLETLVQNADWPFLRSLRWPV